MGKRSAMVPQCHLVEISWSVQGRSKESPLDSFDNKKSKKSILSWTYFYYLLIWFTWYLTENVTIDYSEQTNKIDENAIN